MRSRTTEHRSPMVRWRSAQALHTRVTETLSGAIYKEREHVLEPEEVSNTHLAAWSLIHRSCELMQLRLPASSVPGVWWQDIGVVATDQRRLVLG